LQSTLPNVGTGALKPREDVKLLGTAKETTLLNAASPFYKTFAVDCSRSQVACDMLIFGGQYSDHATLSKSFTWFAVKAEQILNVLSQAVFHVILLVKRISIQDSMLREPRMLSSSLMNSRNYLQNKSVWRRLFASVLPRVFA
jgi:hypothetical protein